MIPVYESVEFEGILNRVRVVLDVVKVKQMGAWEGV